jgi:hypothetical protein
MSPVREAAPGARGSDARPAACPTQTGTDAVASRLASQHPLRKNHPALNRRQDGARARECLWAARQWPGLRVMGKPESG